MRARFIGDPVERSEGRFTNPPSDEWFDIPEGEEAKYRGNSHYEVEGEAAPPAAPKRAARKAAPKPIQTDGWDDAEDEA